MTDECLEGSLTQDVKGRIIGIKAQMLEYKLLFGLCLCERILKITNKLKAKHFKTNRYLLLKLKL